MIADKSNMRYITDKIKKQAYQFASLHSDKPFQTKKPKISQHGRLL